VLIARHAQSPESISFWRFVVGAAVLLAVFGRRALWRAVRPQLGPLVGAGACMASYVLCWFLGIARIGAAVPTLIALCLPPVLVTLVAVLPRARACRCRVAGGARRGARPARC
jgi:DME family drug/metabolite transporter